MLFYFLSNNKCSRRRKPSNRNNYNASYEEGTHQIITIKQEFFTIKPYKTTTNIFVGIRLYPETAERLRHCVTFYIEIPRKLLEY